MLSAPVTNVTRDPDTHLVRYDFSDYLELSKKGAIPLSTVWIESLDRYFNHGIETGGFLRAVLENDLFRAIRIMHMSDRADGIAKLTQLYEMLCEGAPSDGWGSADKVSAWLSSWQAGGSRCRL